MQNCDMDIFGMAYYLYYMFCVYTVHSMQILHKHFYISMRFFARNNFVI